MECFVAFLLVLVTLAVISGIGGGAAVRSWNAKSAYELIARQYRGRVLGGGWFGRRHVVFWYRGESRILVWIARTRRITGQRSASTQVIAPWPNAAFRCEIWPAALRFNSTPQDGLQEISTGSADFDRRFCVRGNDRREAVRALGPVVQRQILRLYALPSPVPVRLDFARGQLIVTKQGAIRHAASLREFVAEVLELYDQALLTQSRGIQFLEDAADVVEAQPLGTVICRVCGEEITEGLVFCHRCKTPHHRDCWLYTGVCSVFACGETQFEVPQVAQRVLPSTVPHESFHGSPPTPPVPHDTALADDQGRGEVDSDFHAR